MSACITGHRGSSCTGSASREGVCIQGGLHPHPYSQQVGGTHPTGMYTCLVISTTLDIKVKLYHLICAQDGSKEFHLWFDTCIVANSRAPFTHSRFQLFKFYFTVKPLILLVCREI